jgi:HUS1 checkpoint protein
MLALTIITTTSSNTYSAFPAASNNHDGFDASFDNEFGGGNRETIVTQEIPVRVLAPDTVASLHEPSCREPDVHIMLPPLMQLKSISDRFTKLALADTKTGSGSTASRTRLEVAANMHGCLKMSIKTDAMSISSVWTDLSNPDLDPNQVEGGESGIADHPSTRMRLLGTADGRSEEGWASVRIDGRDWGKVMSVGRLGGRVIACEEIRLMILQPLLTKTRLLSRTRTHPLRLSTKRTQRGGVCTYSMFPLDHPPA